MGFLPFLTFLAYLVCSLFFFMRLLLIYVKTFIMYNSMTSLYFSFIFVTFSVFSLSFLSFYSFLLFIWSSSPYRSFSLPSPHLPTKHHLVMEALCYSDPGIVYEYVHPIPLLIPYSVVMDTDV